MTINKHSSADMKIKIKMELFQNVIMTLCGHCKGEADYDILNSNSSCNLFNNN